MQREARPQSPLDVPHAALSFPLFQYVRMPPTVEIGCMKCAHFKHRRVTVVEFIIGAALATKYRVQRLLGEVVDLPRAVHAAAVVGTYVGVR